ncbi:MAG: hypothetical protein ABR567_10135 [Myxococcales bacterium]|nr:hypothetical protein [Myxococcales bacterium]
MIRGLAVRLVKHAARVLGTSPWSEAMKSELEHIDGDYEALCWAIGCVVASYVERSSVATLLHTPTARGLLAVAVLTQVLAFLFATALTLAVRLEHLRIAAFLGKFTPGDDYRRFIPLIDATPWWIHVLWITASALFLACAIALLLDRRAAFAAFAAAWPLGAIGNWISESTPVYRQTFSFPAPSFARDVAIPAAAAIVPAMIAVALWIHARRVSRANLRQ